MHSLVLLNCADLQVLLFQDGTSESIEIVEHMEVEDQRRVSTQLSEVYLEGVRRRSLQNNEYIDDDNI